MALQHPAQVLERVNLDLPHPFSRHANLVANLFERLSTIAMQSESTFDDGPLLVTELADPVIHNFMHVLSLRTS